MIGDGKVFVTTCCPFVPLCVVHDPVDGGAEAPLAVVPVLTGAVQEVVVHAQVVPQLMGHVLNKITDCESNCGHVNIYVTVIPFDGFQNL